MNNLKRIFSDGRIGVFCFGNLKRVDWMLIVLTLALAAVGLVNMYSATYGSASGADDRELLDTWFGKQLLFFLAGLAFIILLICIDYRFLVSAGPALYTVMVILLAAVLEFGTKVNGAIRWLDLGVIRLQPSEFAKITLVLMLAWYLSLIGPRIRKVHYFLLAFILMAIPCGLILKQPSLGVAVALIPMTIIMVYAAGCRWWYLGLPVIMGLMIAPLVWMQVQDYRTLDPKVFEEKTYPLGFQLKTHQLDRIVTFLDPEEHPRENGWQGLQSLITVGSGELSGKGFCKGTQTHFSFLPEFHNDMIFALLAEEWGFLGSAAVVVLFLIFLMRILALCRMCPDPAGNLIMAGCATILSFHAFANIGITIGLLPVTGMPLPFLSYGGSFYTTTMICVGLVLSVHVRRKLYV